MAFSTSSLIRRRPGIQSALSLESHEVRTLGKGRACLQEGPYAVPPVHVTATRRHAIWLPITASLLCFSSTCSAKEFETLASGLRVLDLREGTGAAPAVGNLVEVHWSGYTAGYQGKRIDNTSVRDEPFSFRIGDHQVIVAFEEAVLGMRVGGIRRIDVPGSAPQLGYARNRSDRFSSELLSSDLKLFRYRVGPQPAELGGQRALDFVLDNTTLQDFNRDLVFDIKLLAVRP